MIGAIVFFVLLFGYFGIVKGESDSLKVFLAIIGIVAVVWLIGSFSNDNNGMTDADYEKIRIYEENHKKQTYIFRKNRTKSEQKTIKRRFPINWKPLYISNKNTPIYLNLTVAIDQLSGHENRTRRNPSPYFLRFT